MRFEVVMRGCGSGVVEKEKEDMKIFMYSSLYLRIVGPRYLIFAHALHC